MDVDALIEEVIGREGGYTNHPADKGGATRWGVTEKVARAHGYAGDMRAFPRGEAVRIYRRIYWLRPGFDRVAEHAPKVAAELFDTGVNMGPPVAAGFLHRALNALNRREADYPDMPVDRRIGPRTIEALRSFIATRETRRNGAAQGLGSAPGRTLPRAGRAAARQRSLPLRLARQPPRMKPFLG